MKDVIAPDIRLLYYLYFVGGKDSILNSADLKKKDWDAANHLEHLFSRKEYGYDVRIQSSVPFKDILEERLIGPINHIS